jgi:hypothetical protein
MQTPPGPPRRVFADRIAELAVARYLHDMNLHSPKPDKYKAYRARKKAAGLRQVRIWTLDPDAPGFREAMNAAFARERESKEARALLDASEANAAEVWRDLP